MKFRCIVADPPWKVSSGRALGKYLTDKNGKQLFNIKNNNSRMLAYDTMSLTEMSAMSIPAEKDCHLYLWTINRYLPNAFEIMSSWGFSYSTTIVWAKKPMGGGLGDGVVSFPSTERCYGLATEFCLFGRKGKLKAETKIPRNWFDWKRPYNERGKPKHFAKPKEFFEMVEKVSPGPRLEMFARNKREGWIVWGNEVESDIAL
jgi:N6-adenosine-specific RNA methylase IME4